MAEAFHCDPIQLLDVDYDEWLIRLAAAKALAHDHAERDKKMRGAQGGY